jgi:hypothetical protein
LTWESNRRMEQWFQVARSPGQTLGQTSRLVAIRRRPDYLRIRAAAAISLALAPTEVSHKDTDRVTEQNYIEGGAGGILRWWAHLVTGVGDADDLEQPPPAGDLELCTGAVELEQAEEGQPVVEEKEQRGSLGQRRRGSRRRGLSGSRPMRQWEGGGGARNQEAAGGNAKQGGGTWAVRK